MGALPSPVAASTSGSSHGGLQLGAEPGAAEVGLRDHQVAGELLDTVSSIDCLTDAATTVNSVTTATPTISADAVPAVRRGLRMALRRASLPLIPAAKGQRPAHGAGDRAGHDGSEKHEAHHDQERAEAGHWQ